MPVYCYTCPTCGRAREQFASVAERKQQLFCECGANMLRDLRAEHAGVRHTPGNWPMLSEAAAVDAEQVPYMRKFLAERGIHTEYVADEAGAKPVFTSARHRKAHCEAIGFHDLNGGFNDPQKR